MLYLTMESIATLTFLLFAKSTFLKSHGSKYNLKTSKAKSIFMKNLSPLRGKTFSVLHKIHQNFHMIKQRSQTYYWQNNTFLQLCPQYKCKQSESKVSLSASFSNSLKHPQSTAEARQIVLSKASSWRKIEMYRSS